MVARTYFIQNNYELGNLYLIQLSFSHSNSSINQTCRARYFQCFKVY